MRQEWAEIVSNQQQKTNKKLTVATEERGKMMMISQEIRSSTAESVNSASIKLHNYISMINCAIVA
jgi:hypothetical protein